MDEVEKIKLAVSYFNFFLVKINIQVNAYKIYRVSSPVGIDKLGIVISVVIFRLLLIIKFSLRCTFFSCIQRLSEDIGLCIWVWKCMFRHCNL